MIINISELVNNKIKELEESKKIEETITNTLEKTILSAVEDAMGSYEIRRIVKSNLTEQISTIISDIGLEGYNTFIAEKLKQIIDGTCKKDIEQKIQETFKNLLIVKREKIKLSEIFSTYREWISENLDDDEKSCCGFYASFDKSSYGWYHIVLAKEEPTFSKCDFFLCSIRFTVHINRDGEGWIGSLYLNDENVEESMPFGYLNDVESLLINLKYNKTPIIIDIEDEDDIDTSYIGKEE